VSLIARPCRFIEVSVGDLAVHVLVVVGPLALTVVEDVAGVAARSTGAGELVVDLDVLQLAATGTFTSSIDTTK